VSNSRIPVVDSIAWRIMRARKEAGLTQAELAQILYVSRTVVGNWERGNYEPRLGEAQKIAIATGKPLEFLCPSA
jgi:DNA-binding XRE family transcriptional regulator